jgi:hypothetical protein
VLTERPCRTCFGLYGADHRFRHPSANPGRKFCKREILIVRLQTMFHAFFVQIELFHHSRDVPAAVSKLNATLDRASGAVTKHNPRFA